MFSFVILGGAGRDTEKGGNLLPGVELWAISRVSGHGLNSLSEAHSGEKPAGFARFRIFSLLNKHNGLLRSTTLEAVDDLIPVQGTRPNTRYPHPHLHVLAVVLLFSQALARADVVLTLEVFPDSTQLTGQISAARS